MFNVIIGGLVSTISFSLYVTFHPGLKGIAFRPDDTGTARFRPINILSLMASPFYNIDLWKLKVLGTNYVVWLVGGTSLLYLVKTILNNKALSLNGIGISR